jgi:hypothetical protein
MSDMPPGVMEMMLKIWRDNANLRILILPRDAWTALAVIQFSTRNPQLSDEQRNAAIRVGRILQDALTLRWLREHEDWNPN